MLRTCCKDGRWTEVTQYWSHSVVWYYIQMVTIKLNVSCCDVFCSLKVAGQAMFLQRQHWGAFVKPLLSWKSSQFYIFRVCVCSLCHLTCKAHVLCYIVLCGLSGWAIFSHTVSWAAWFSQKNSCWTQNVCPTTFVWNVSHSKKNSVRYYHKCT